MKAYCIFVFALLFLAACASGDARTPTGAQNPNAGREGAQRCLGGSLDRDLCAKFANQRCGSGFEVFEQDAKEEDGVVRRAFYYKCLM